MLVSEAEARTEKWCPFNRQRHGEAGEAAANRSSQGALVGRCVASQCMAWRPVADLTDAPGYCGLAGQPAAAFMES